MIYTVKVQATVEYQCNLSDEDTEKIKKFIQEKEESPDDESPYTLEEVVEKLYFNGEIDLYDDYAECDFETNKIIQVTEE